MTWSALRVETATGLGGPTGRTGDMADEVHTRALDCRLSTPVAGEMGPADLRDATMTARCLRPERRHGREQAP